MNYEPILLLTQKIDEALFTYKNLPQAVQSVLIESKEQLLKIYSEPPNVDNATRILEIIKVILAALGFAETLFK